MSSGKEENGTKRLEFRGGDPLFREIRPGGSLDYNASCIIMEGAQVAERLLGLVPIINEGSTNGGRRWPRF